MEVSALQQEHAGPVQHNKRQASAAAVENTGQMKYNLEEITISPSTATTGTPSSPTTAGATHHTARLPPSSLYLTTCSIRAADDINRNSADSSPAVPSSVGYPITQTDLVNGKDQVLKLGGNSSSTNIKTASLTNTGGFTAGAAALETLTAVAASSASVEFTTAASAGPSVSAAAPACAAAVTSASASDIATPAPAGDAGSDTVIGSNYLPLFDSVSPAAIRGGPGNSGEKEEEATEEKKIEVVAAPRKAAASGVDEEREKVEKHQRQQQEQVTQQETQKVESILLASNICPVYSAAREHLPAAIAEEEDTALSSPQQQQQTLSGYPQPSETGYIFATQHPLAFQFTSRNNTKDSESDSNRISNSSNSTNSTSKYCIDNIDPFEQHSTEFGAAVGVVEGSEGEYLHPVFSTGAAVLTWRNTAKLVISGAIESDNCNYRASNIGDKVCSDDASYKNTPPSLRTHSSGNRCYSKGGGAAAATAAAATAAANCRRNSSSNGDKIEHSSSCVQAPQAWDPRREEDSHRNAIRSTACPTVAATARNSSAFPVSLSCREKVNKKSAAIGQQHQQQKEQHSVRRKEIGESTAAFAKCNSEARDLQRNIIIERREQDGTSIGRCSYEMQQQRQRGGGTLAPSSSGPADVSSSSTSSSLGSTVSTLLSPATYGPAAEDARSSTPTAPGEQQQQHGMGLLSGSSSCTESSNQLHTFRQHNLFDGLGLHSCSTLASMENLLKSPLPPEAQKTNSNSNRATTAATGEGDEEQQQADPTTSAITEPSSATAPAVAAPVSLRGGGTSAAAAFVSPHNTTAGRTRARQQEQHQSHPQQQQRRLSGEEEAGEEQQGEQQQPHHRRHFAREAEGNIRGGVTLYHEEGGREQEGDGSPYPRSRSYNQNVLSPHPQQRLGSGNSNSNTADNLSENMYLQQHMHGNAGSCATSSMWGGRGGTNAAAATGTLSLSGDHMLLSGSLSNELDEQQQRQTQLYINRHHPGSGTDGNAAATTNLYSAHGERDSSYNSNSTGGGGGGQHIWGSQNQSQTRSGAGAATATGSLYDLQIGGESATTATGDIRQQQGPHHHTPTSYSAAAATPAAEHQADANASPAAAATGASPYGEGGSSQRFPPSSGLGVTAAGGNCNRNPRSTIPQGSSYTTLPLYASKEDIPATAANNTSSAGGQPQHRPGSPPGAATAGHIGPWLSAGGAERRAALLEGTETMEHLSGGYDTITVAGRDGNEDATFLSSEESCFSESLSRKERPSRPTGGWRGYGRGSGLLLQQQEPGGGAGPQQQRGSSGVVEGGVRGVSRASDEQLSPTAVAAAAADEKESLFASASSPHNNSSAGEGSNSNNSQYMHHILRSTSDDSNSGINWHGRDRRENEYTLLSGEAGGCAGGSGNGPHGGGHITSSSRGAGGKMIQQQQQMIYENSSPAHEHPPGVITHSVGRSQTYSGGLSSSIYSGSSSTGHQPQQPQKNTRGMLSDSSNLMDASTATGSPNSSTALQPSDYTYSTGGGGGSSSSSRYTRVTAADSASPVAGCMVGHAPTTGDTRSGGGVLHSTAQHQQQHNSPHSHPHTGASDESSGRGAEAGGAVVYHSQQGQWRGSSASHHSHAAGQQQHHDAGRSVVVQHHHHHHRDSTSSTILNISPGSTGGYGGGGEDICLSTDAVSYLNSPRCTSTATTSTASWAQQGMRGSMGGELPHHRQQHAILTSCCSPASLEQQCLYYPAPGSGSLCADGSDAQQLAAVVADAVKATKGGSVGDITERRSREYHRLLQASSGGVADLKDHHSKNDGLYIHRTGAAAILGGGSEGGGGGQQQTTSNGSSSSRRLNMMAGMDGEEAILLQQHRHAVSTGCSNNIGYGLNLIRGGSAEDDPAAAIVGDARGYILLGSNSSTEAAAALRSQGGDIDDIRQQQQRPHRPRDCNMTAGGMRGRLLLYSEEERDTCMSSPIRGDNTRNDPLLTLGDREGEREGVEESTRQNREEVIHISGVGAGNNSISSSSHREDLRARTSRSGSSSSSDKDELSSDRCITELTKGNRCIRGAPRATVQQLYGQTYDLEALALEIDRTSLDAMDTGEIKRDYYPGVKFPVGDLGRKLLLIAVREKMEAGTCGQLKFLTLVDLFRLAYELGMWSFALKVSMAYKAGGLRIPKGSLGQHTGDSSASSTYSQRGTGGSNVGGGSSLAVRDDELRWFSCNTTDGAGGVGGGREDMDVISSEGRRGEDDECIGGSDHCGGGSITAASGADGVLALRTSSSSGNSTNSTSRRGGRKKGRKGGGVTAAAIQRGTRSSTAAAVARGTRSATAAIACSEEETDHVPRLGQRKGSSDSRGGTGGSPISTRRRSTDEEQQQQQAHHLGRREGREGEEQKREGPPHFTGGVTDVREELLKQRETLVVEEQGRRGRNGSIGVIAGEEGFLRSSGRDHPHNADGIATTAILQQHRLLGHVTATTGGGGGGLLGTSIYFDEEKFQHHPHSTHHPSEIRHEHMRQEQQYMHLFQQQHHKSPMYNVIGGVVGGEGGMRSSSLGGGISPNTAAEEENMLLLQQQGMLRHHRSLLPHHTSTTPVAASEGTRMYHAAGGGGRLVMDLHEEEPHNKQSGNVLSAGEQQRREFDILPHQTSIRANGTMASRGSLFIPPTHDDTDEHQHPLQRQRLQHHTPPSYLHESSPATATSTGGCEETYRGYGREEEAAARGAADVSIRRQYTNSEEETGRHIREGLHVLEARGSKGSDSHVNKTEETGLAVAAPEKNWVERRREGDQLQPGTKACEIDNRKNISIKTPTSLATATTGEPQQQRRSFSAAHRGGEGAGRRGELEIDAVAGSSQQLMVKEPRKYIIEGQRGNDVTTATRKREASAVDEEPLQQVVYHNSNNRGTGQSEGEVRGGGSSETEAVHLWGHQKLPVIDGSGYDVGEKKNSSINKESQQPHFSNEREQLQEQPQHQQQLRGNESKQDVTAEEGDLQSTKSRSSSRSSGGVKEAPYGVGLSTISGNVADAAHGTVEKDFDSGGSFHAGRIGSIIQRKGEELSPGAILTRKGHGITAAAVSHSQPRNISSTSSPPGKRMRTMGEDETGGGEEGTELLEKEKIHSMSSSIEISPNIEELVVGSRVPLAPPPPPCPGPPGPSSHHPPTSTSSSIYSSAAAGFLLLDSDTRNAAALVGEEEEEQLLLVPPGERLSTTGTRTATTIAQEESVRGMLWNDGRGSHQTEEEEQHRHQRERESLRRQRHSDISSHRSTTGSGSSNIFLPEDSGGAGSSFLLRQNSSGSNSTPLIHTQPPHRSDSNSSSSSTTSGVDEEPLLQYRTSSSSELLIAPSAGRNDSSRTEPTADDLYRGGGLLTDGGNEEESGNLVDGTAAVLVTRADSDGSQNAETLFWGVEEEGRHGSRRRTVDEEGVPSQQQNATEEVEEDRRPEETREAHHRHTNLKTLGSRGDGGGEENVDGPPGLQFSSMFSSLLEREDPDWRSWRSDPLVRKRPQSPYSHHAL